MPTAILVDGEFFLKRLRFLRGSQTPHQAEASADWSR